MQSKYGPLFPVMEQAALVYDDKWGPAVAIQAGPDTWAFAGYASS